MQRVLIIIFIILSTSVSGFAACNRPIDPSKVMLFIDTNKSDLEIETTEKAACERGQRLIIVPSNYKENDILIQNVIDTKKALDKCEKANQKCGATLKSYNDALDESKKFSRARKNVTDEIKEALQTIKHSGGKLQNITISGHDGGGIFSGYKGSFNRAELGALMNDFRDINEVSSLLLLGCYTGVPKEIIEWKQLFPEVKLIAGYDAKAPFSDKPAGHQYIEDVLIKEKQLLQNSDQKKLQNFAKENIRSLSLLNSSLYLTCSDGTSEVDYYYGSQREGKNFETFNIKECESKRAEIEEIISLTSKYASGELEIPEDTNGELRKVYTKARNIEHCGEILNLPLNLNSIFNLLFYDGVKKNFATFYQKDLQTAESIINELNLEEFEAGFKSRSGELLKSLEEMRAQMNDLESDPNGYLEKTDAKLKSMENAYEELLRNPELAEIKHLLEEKYLMRPLPSDLSENQKELIRRAKKEKSLLSMAKYELDHLRKNLSSVIPYLKQKLPEKEKLLEAKIATFESVKRDLFSANKKVWVPNKENLAKKSRKEALENLNYVEGLLSIPGLPQKQKNALSWMQTVTTRHLQQFQNPFNWHEFTGEVEAPTAISSLDDYLKFKSVESSLGPYSPSNLDTLREIITTP